MTLALERFREVIAYNPYHFWQLASEKIPVRSSCNTLVREHAWQFADGAGRQEMRDAIAEAERKLITHLGYYPESTYSEESIEITCLAHSGASWYRFIPDAVKLSVGKLRSIGTETPSLLKTATVSYSDENGDGLIDTFSAQFADSTSDVSTLAVYLRSDDYVGGADLARRQVSPVNIQRKDDQTIAITGRSWLLVRPALYEGYSQELENGIDPCDESKYVAEVDIYQITTSAPNKATLTYYDNDNLKHTLDFDAYIEDSNTGYVKLYTLAPFNYLFSTPLVFACTCGNYRFRRPTISVNYRSGDSDDWSTTLTRFALAELRRRICACDDANREITYWQMDLALPVGPAMARISIDPSDLANPIGTRAGYVEAWKRIVATRMSRGLFA